MSIRTPSLCLLLLGLAPLAGLGAPERAAASDKLHPALVRLLDERGPSKAWVFFTDKGVRDGAALRAALDRAAADLHPRTRARRLARRTRPGLVDLADVPVDRAYVDATLASGVTLGVETSWLNAISVTGSRADLERVAALPFVERLEPVRRGVVLDRLAPVEPGSEVSQAKPDAATAGFWGLSRDQLDQIGVASVHLRGFTGAGVVVGILDTGFHRGHEAFNQPGHVVSVLAEWDFVDGDGNTDIELGDDPSQHAHGTYILGTLAAWLPGELVGGAYDASFILCKTEDITNEYQQEEDFYVAGLQFIEANGGDMATSSLGYIDWYTQSNLNGLTAKTTLAVNVATANGVHCCTAAGNSGYDSNPTTSNLIAPADAFDVITMGAVDEYGDVAYFSSDGPSADGRTKPELCARGYETWTVCAFTDTDCTTQVSGTSLSTPVMASAVACLIQAHPTWTVDDMRQSLLRTGDYFRKNGGPDPLFVVGYGIPNADVAGFSGPRLRPAPGKPRRVR